MAESNIFFRIISVVWAYLFSLIGGKRTRNMNALTISFKFSSELCIPIDVDPTWTIEHVKNTLSRKAAIPASDIKLIFAGKELTNTCQVKDCDVGQLSIIHAVRVAKSSITVTATTSNNPCSAFLHLYSGSGDNSLRKSKTQVGFYVFCNMCKSLQPGKLRVRCNVCKQGTLTVSKDPCGWNDVLVPKQISGTCQSENCEGDFAEIYFKCGSHPSTDKDTCVALYLIKSNVKDISCMACTEVWDPVLVFPCRDGHVMCLECFVMYCNTRLNDRQFVQHEEFGYTLPCPAGCDNSFIKESHHFKLLGDDQYSRYQQFGTEECLLQAGGVLCPMPGCGAGILPDPECRKIVCVQQGGHGCGFVFCRGCLQGYHLGECEDNQIDTEGNQPGFPVNLNHAENSRWDEASKVTIKVMTKPCPKCRTPTERDGGCMHLVCTRSQCGFHWCWVCQTEWTRQCMGDHWFG